MFKIAKQMAKERQDMVGVNCLKDGVYGATIKCREGNRAGGPPELVGEIIHAAGQVGVKKMTEICNTVLDEVKIPRDWELSTLLPIDKGKGDPLECGAHRAMKVFERVGKY